MFWMSRDIHVYIYINTNLPPENFSVSLPTDRKLLILEPQKLPLKTEGIWGSLFVAGIYRHTMCCTCWLKRLKGSSVRGNKIEMNHFYFVFVRFHQALAHQQQAVLQQQQQQQQAGLQQQVAPQQASRRLQQREKQRSHRVDLRNGCKKSCFAATSISCRHGWRGWCIAALQGIKLS